MRLALFCVTSAGLALGLTACFDEDSTTDPAPVANPIAPTVGSAMNAPLPGQPGIHAAEASDPGGARAMGPRGTEQLAEADIAFRVENPRSGASLAVYAELPSSSPPYKAIVVVPGGVKSAAGIFNRPQMRQPILDNGVAIFRFDPDGRGLSGGEEDMGGANQQAGLRAVIQAVIARDDVIDDKVGLFSNSMGVQMAAGALADGDTGARFLIDYEGPSDRAYVAGCKDPANTPQPPWPPTLSCGDDAYWGEREAVGNIAKLTVPYQRLQRASDHVHATEAGHAFSLYQAALEGPCPWVRLNTLEPNASLASVQQAQRPDVSIPTLFGWYPDYIEDMFLVIDGDKPLTRNHTTSDGVGSEPPRGPGQRGGKGSKRGPPANR